MKHVQIAHIQIDAVSNTDPWEHERDVALCEAYMASKHTTFCHLFHHVWLGKNLWDVGQDAWLYGNYACKGTPAPMYDPSYPEAM